MARFIHSLHRCFAEVNQAFSTAGEALIYNRCHDVDVARPWTWATGAIDNRQNARRLVSRDGKWFPYTIIVAGDPIQLQPHDAGTEIEFRNIRMAEWN